MTGSPAYGPAGLAAGLDNADGGVGEHELGHGHVELVFVNHAEGRDDHQIAHAGARVAEPLSEMMPLPRGDLMAWVMKRSPLLTFQMWTCSLGRMLLASSRSSSMPQEPS
jgi:hypothetical protein